MTRNAEWAARHIRDPWWAWTLRIEDARVHLVNGCNAATKHCALATGNFFGSHGETAVSAPLHVDCVSGKTQVRPPDTACGLCVTPAHVCPLRGLPVTDSVSAKQGNILEWEEISPCAE